MKFIYTAICLLFTLTTFSQFTLSSGYSLSKPQQKMAGNINSLHSLSLGGLYRFPGKLNRVQAGIDFGFGIYATEKKLQTFNFGNGTSTQTWVNYSSNVTQGNLVTRISLFKEQLVNPYVSGKVGYTAFYSNIFIEDPHDPLGCRALDQRNLISDGVITASYGGGVAVNIDVFGKANRVNDVYIDLSVNNVRGGNINYINTRKLVDGNNPAPTDSEGKPLNVTFVNASTQELHEHQVAEVYSTPLRMLEFKIAAVFRIR